MYITVFLYFRVHKDLLDLQDLLEPEECLYVPFFYIYKPAPDVQMISSLHKQKKTTHFTMLLFSVGTPRTPW